jgi:predicted regulator of Ras-like GTPase activity (Roadblock/LC7/MglB family)
MQNTSPTIFAKILKEVVDAIPGALGAIFVDWEGESVDEFSCIGETNLRLVGAHWAIAYQQAQAIFTKLQIGSLKELILRFQTQQVIVRRITEAYLVLLAIGRDTHLGRALHLLAQAESKIREEM